MTCQNPIIYSCSESWLTIVSLRTVILGYGPVRVRRRLSAPLNVSSHSSYQDFTFQEQGKRNESWHNWFNQQDVTVCSTFFFACKSAKHPSWPLRTVIMRHNSVAEARSRIRQVLSTLTVSPELRHACARRLDASSRPWC